MANAKELLYEALAKYWNTVDEFEDGKFSDRPRLRRGIESSLRSFAAVYAKAVADEIGNSVLLHKFAKALSAAWYPACGADPARLLWADVEATLAARKIDPQPAKTSRKRGKSPTTVAVIKCFQKGMTNTNEICYETGVRVRRIDQILCQYPNDCKPLPKRKYVKRSK
jgi:hypothetical protein